MNKQPNHSPRISKGYRYVYSPESPSAKKSGSYKGYVFEHRLVMERNLGRALEPTESVHHIDFNPLNNDISNLMILSNGDHIRLHHLLKGNRISIEDCRDRNNVLRILKINPRRCKDCGAELSVLEASMSKIKRCPQCAMKHRRKVCRPTKGDLILAITGKSLESVARTYGVSGNAVRKWCVQYDIDYKSYCAKRCFSSEARIKSWSSDAKAKRAEKRREWYSKHNSSLSRPVVCFTKDMKVVKEYSKIADAQIDGFVDTSISRCCKRKRESYKGYVWRYKEEVA